MRELDPSPFWILHREMILSSYVTTQLVTIRSFEALCMLVRVVKNTEELPHYFEMCSKSREILIFLYPFTMILEEKRFVRVSQ